MPSTTNGQNSQPEPQTPTNSSGSKGILVVLGVIIAVIVALLIAIRIGAVSAPAWLMKAVPASMVPVISPLTGEEAKLSMMMESGRPGICTITNKADQAQITYYISGEKFRVEIVDTQNGETIQSFVLSDGEYQYNWTNRESQGFKMKMPTKEELEVMEKEAKAMAEEYEADWDFENLSDQYESDEDRYEVDCKFQNVPASTFQVPSDIEFMELGDMPGFMFNEESSADQMDWEQDEDDSGEIEDFDLEGMEEWAQKMQEQYGVE